MSEIIARETQKLEQDAVVEMFELDLRSLGEGILRFSPGPSNNQPVKFGGYEYVPVPIKAEGFEFSGEGSLPTPTLTVSVMSDELAGLIRASGDLVGMKVTRIRTYRSFLDDGETPDSQAMLEPDVYLIERKSSHNSTAVEFELNADFDQRGKQIPGRQVIRDSCTHFYRSWDGSKFVYTTATCPYTGTKYFNSFGTQETSGSKDVCGKRLSDCKNRFGTRATLPFYGFPGAGRL